MMRFLFLPGRRSRLLACLRGARVTLLSGPWPAQRQLVRGVRFPWVAWRPDDEVSILLGASKSSVRVSARGSGWSRGLGFQR